MKLYRVSFYDNDSAAEEGGIPDLWSAGLADARKAARAWLTPEDEGSEAEVQSMEVITHGRGWLVSVLNASGFVESGTRRTIEKWTVKDGRIVRQKPPA